LYRFEVEYSNPVKLYRKQVICHSNDDNNTELKKKNANKHSKKKLNQRITVMLHLGV